MQSFLLNYIFIIIANDVVCIRARFDAFWVKFRRFWCKPFRKILVSGEMSIEWWMGYNRTNQAPFSLFFTWCTRLYVFKEITKLFRGGGFSNKTKKIRKPPLRMICRRWLSGSSALPYPTTIWCLSNFRVAIHAFSSTLHDCLTEVIILCDVAIIRRFIVAEERFLSANETTCIVIGFVCLLGDAVELTRAFFSDAWMFFPASNRSVQVSHT